MASDPYFEKRRGVWKLKYRPDPTGPWVSVTLCRHPTDWSPSKPPKKPPQEAIDRAKDFAEIEYRAKHGLGAAPARARSLAAYLDGYVASQALSAKAGSAEQLARHVRTFKAFAEGRGVTSIQAVTKALCREYMEERIKSVSHATLKTERGYLIGIWTRAVDDGLLVTNPWSKLPTPGLPKETSITFWTSEEIRKIAGACSKPWQSDLVVVLANTGLRISTALAMAWDWIDWAKGSIKIPIGVEEVKTAYSTSMARAARDVLERRYAMSKGSPLVFPNPIGDGGVVGYETARAAIDRAIRKSKVPLGTPHDLRHSYGRALALAGVPITVIQSQLGHTTLAMTLKYVQTNEEQAAKFVADFGVGDGSG